MNNEHVLYSENIKVNLEEAVVITIVDEDEFEGHTFQIPLTAEEAIRIGREIESYGYRLRKEETK